MKEENKIGNLVTVIRNEISYIKRYEAFLLEYSKSVENLTKDFGTKVMLEDVEDEEIVNFCLKTFTLKAAYSRDIKILYNNVVNYYKALVILKSKDLLKEEEIKLIESVNEKLDKVNFVINEKDELVEKVKGYTDLLKENIKKSGQLDTILKSFRSQIK